MRTCFLGERIKVMMLMSFLKAGYGWVQDQCARRHFMLDKPLKSLPCSGHQMQTHLLHTNVSLGSQRDGCWARDHNTLPPAQTLEDEAFHLPGLREVRSLHLIPLQQKPPQLSAGVDCFSLPQITFL